MNGLFLALSIAFLWAVYSGMLSLLLVLMLGRERKIHDRQLSALIGVGEKEGTPIRLNDRLKEVRAKWRAQSAQGREVKKNDQL